MYKPFKEVKPNETFIFLQGFYVREVIKPSDQPHYTPDGSQTNFGPDTPVSNDVEDYTPAEIRKIEREGLSFQVYNQYKTLADFKSHVNALEYARLQQLKYPYMKFGVVAKD